VNFLLISSPNSTSMQIANCETFPSLVLIPPEPRILQVLENIFDSRDPCDSSYWLVGLEDVFEVSQVNGFVYVFLAFKCTIGTIRCKQSPLGLG